MPVRNLYTKGKILGTVPHDQIVDAGSKIDIKVGDSVKARVLDSSKKIVFTLKKSLVESKLPILCKFEDAKVNGVHHGTVIKIHNEGVLVRFFDNVKGWIPNRFLNTRNASKNFNFSIGKTITTVVKTVNADKKKIILSPLHSDEEGNFEIGDVVEGIVTDSSVVGVHLQIVKYNNTTAYLPAGHMSPCLEVGKLLAAKTVAGEKLSVIVFSIQPSLIVSTTIAPEKTYNNANSIGCGDTILCSIKKITKESIKVLLPIRNFQKYGTIPISHTENIEAMYTNKIIFAKVMRPIRENREIHLTTQIIHIWEDLKKSELQMMDAVDLLSLHLNKILELSKNVFYASRLISKVNIGYKMKGIIVSVMSDGLILKLEGNIKGIIRKGNYQKAYNTGEQVEGSVIWISYPHEYIELSLLPTIIKSIGIKQNKSTKIPIGIQLRGEIVLVTDWFVLAILKGQSKGTIVALPVRRHLNDIVPDLSPYQNNCKIRCYGVLNKDDANILLPICVFKSAFETHNHAAKISCESSRLLRKRKTQEILVMEKNSNPKKMKNLKFDEEKRDKNNKQSMSVTTTTSIIDLNKMKTKLSKKKKNSRKENISIANQNYSEITSVDDETKMKQKSKDYRNAAARYQTAALMNLSISECGFQWNNINNGQAVDSSSDSGDAIETPNEKEKKKIASIEVRRDTERIKEKKVRECEEALNSFQIPQTDHEFDRLLLANPNNSLVWVQYMVHYLQVSNIEKARSIAKRALKNILFHEENERLNIWQAWLNLESKFGSLESLNIVLQEALKTTNAERVYHHLLSLHLNGGRHAEIEKVVNIMITKYKYKLDTWINCMSVFFEIGLKEKARHIMQKALQSLSEHNHIDLIVRFAILESKYGDKEQSQTLFESLLGKYKNRTDVWSSYVDSLVKSGEIDIARKVLERAVAERFPVKKMKFLLKKYVCFETEHGSLDQIIGVRQIAEECVNERYKNTAQLTTCSSK